MPPVCATRDAVNLPGIEPEACQIQLDLAHAKIRKNSAGKLLVFAV